MLGFLSGALQIVPLELCASITPNILSFSEIQDPKIKLNAYLTLEVLFASRRFSNDGSQALVGTRTLKHLLDNAEILSLIEYQEEREGHQQVRFEKHDEMRVVAYIQAVSQVVLNIASSSHSSAQDLDTCLKLIAATFSVMSEYMLDSTQRIKLAAAAAVRLIITHGLGKLKSSDLQ